MDNRYRYRELTAGVYRLRLRDDGYRIEAQIIEPKDNSAAGEWVLWAEYKQCDLPRIGHIVADALMAPDSTPAPASPPTGDER